MTGVHFNSLFNELLYFHVTQGTPPCPGHDTFEGVVLHDVPLIIRELENLNRGLTVEIVNRRMTNYPFRGSDADDRPGSVAANCKRLSGNAVQNWTFLRFLPLVVADKIQDLENDAWEMLILLTQIIQLVCAPCTTEGLRAILWRLISEYLELRVKLFPNNNRRPKHHYLYHYPYLCLRYGPLFKVCTLRGESKHSYFKNCQQGSHNTKNVTKTLSYRHQLFQAAMMDQFFEDGPAMKKCAPFRRSLLSAVGLATLTRKIPEDEWEQLEVGDSVTFRGFGYTRGMFLIIGNDELHPVLCRIGNILLLRQHVYVIGEKIAGRINTDLQIIEMREQHEACTVCVSLEELTDCTCYPACEHHGPVWFGSSGLRST